MSLNWSLTKIKDHKTVCYEYREKSAEYGIFESGDCMKALTDALIWATMAVDIGEITEKNAEEFHWRVKELEETYNQPFLRYLDDNGEVQKRPITLEEVRAHIGLSTNVMTISRKQWIAKMLKWQKREMEARAKQAVGKSS